MLEKSPSGALSPYYYKGGSFHGIHYGSYFGDADALLDMIDREEAFILKSPERRRIMMDIYETELSERVLERLVAHIAALEPKIQKLSIATDRKNLRLIDKAIKKSKALGVGRYFLTTDMEEGKTWLVSDS